MNTSSDLLYIFKLEQSQHFSEWSSWRWSRKFSGIFEDFCHNFLPRGVIPTCFVVERCCVARLFFGLVFQNVVFADMLEKRNRSLHGAVKVALQHLLTSEFCSNLPYPVYCQLQKEIITRAYSSSFGCESRKVLVKQMANVYSTSTVCPYILRWTHIQLQ